MDDEHVIIEIRLDIVEPPGDVDAARSEGQDLTSVGSSIFSKSCLPMSLICGFAFLIVGLLIAVAVYYKYGRNGNNKTNGNEDVEMDKLMKNMKRDLEKSRNEIKVQVDELEGHREENKKMRGGDLKAKVAVCYTPASYCILIVMRYSVVISALVGICTWFIWKLLINGPTDKKTVPVKINPQWSQDSTKLNLQDQLLFKPEFTSLSGSLPLEKVFFVLIIHICGADLVESITTVCHRLWSVAGLIELTVSTATFAFATYKWKREKKRLQEELLHKEREREDVVITLMEVKAEQENQRDQTKGQLEEVERGREENKQNLQSVEKMIEESEMMSEKPQELLKLKEKLLNEKWRLDQSKEGYEKQLLDYEKVLEPVDFQMAKLQPKGKVGM
ncbi:hypothetical protein Q5P01_000349 [Channa striata]|uniref:Uncharacterized protein n=1 Tax=Channa striata TaxID=64152 RepID=A0AA88LIC0_CHASR|nr:hypothetical protein Q5P01_000349 [Channa striata]